MKHKTLFFLLALQVTAFTAVIAQTKYALIFSRLPVVSGEDKIIARNNFTTIADALKIQGFEEQNISYDTTQCTRAGFIKQLTKLSNIVRLNDFVFLYFDLPVSALPDIESEMGIVFDSNKPHEFISSSELGTLLSTIYIKSDPGLIYSFFDSPPIDFKSPMNCIFSGREDEKRIRGGDKSWVYENTSIFARAVAEAITSKSTFITNYESLFTAIQQYIFSYGSHQRPVLKGNLTYPLFNGSFKRFPVHFEIRDQLDESTVIINGGESLNILPGAKVKLYLAFSDTTRENLIAEGKISTTTRYSSTVQLSKPCTNPIDKVWAYVFENEKEATLLRVDFNSSFNGSPDYHSIFNEIIDLLKKSEVAKYIKFVNRGGDVCIKDISASIVGGVNLTFGNPVSGLIYEDLVVDYKNDISDLKALIKRFARYQYLSRIRNYIPELKIDFSIKYLDSTKVIQTENGYPILYDGDEIQCALTNKNPAIVYYAIIDMQPDMRLNPVFPNKYAIDKAGNRAPIGPLDCTIPPFSSVSLKDWIITLFPPFGIERFKIITSLEPILPGDLDALMLGDYIRRGASLNIETVNIQDFDFEIRNSAFATGFIDSRVREIKATLSTKSSSTANTYTISNQSADKIYFNLLKQKNDGSYDFLLPNSVYSETKCFVNSKDSFMHDLSGDLKQYDQVITVYADRPFMLNDYSNDEKQLNDLIVEILRTGRIAGSPLNKIALLQELYFPKKETVSKDGENIFIKLITPKISTERGGEVTVKTKGFDINGFAASKENKPIKSVTINGEDAGYDPGLKFFESSLNLSNGKNRIVIIATDDQGFTATQKIDVVLEDNMIVAAGRGKNYFLGIGIDNYKTWNPLYNAKNDVIGFSRLMKKKFGFDSSDVRLLLDTLATRKNIINSIRYYLSKAGPNDNVIIYLSGHGNEDQLADGGYYFIPQEAEADDVTTAVKSTDIIDNFKKIRAKHCVLIVDACYSGMITNSATPSNQQILSSQSKIAVQDLPSKWVITSGRATKVSDGQKGKNSPFATILINYLTENNDESMLKISKLIDCLKENVPKLNSEQNPLGIIIEGQGEFKFKINN